MKNNLVKYLFGIILLAILIVPVFFYLKDNIVFKNDIGTSTKSFINLNYEGNNVKEFVVDAVKGIPNERYLESKSYDFVVKGSAISNDINFSLVINDNGISDQDIMFMLTTVDNENNEVLIKSTAYSNLVLTDLGCVLDGDIIKAGEVAYGKKYRLRIWINSSNDFTSDAVFKVTLENNLK